MRRTRSSGPAKDFAVGVDDQVLRGFDDHVAASLQMDLGMIARRARRADSGNQSKRFPPREVPRMDAVEPAIVQTCLREPSRTLLPDGRATS